MTHPEREPAVYADANDRWLKRDLPPGIHFAPDDRVILLEGDDAGASGRIVSLQSLAPEPLYTVALDSGAGEVGAFQSGLQPAD